MSVPTLSTRALNRSLLARQLLLHRSDLEPLAALDHLVGMQAQLPLNPYIGLWSRLGRFTTGKLARLIEQRAAVRIVCMRGTIHLVTADDCLVLRPLHQPVLDLELQRHRDVAPLVRGLDMTDVLIEARAILEERPRSGPQLRDALAARFPHIDPAAFVYICRNNLALVQVPPRGMWGKSAQVTVTTAEAWLGRPVVEHPSIDDVMRRYLAAFGPATVADATTWSRLTGLREVFDRLRPELRTFRDEKGRELFDVPDGELADADQPAPTRFLPEYDNALLSHADRSRIVPSGRQWPLESAPHRGTVLHDGFVCATWSIHLDKAAAKATVRVASPEPLPRRATTSIKAEGVRLARFVHPEAANHEVVFAPRS